MDQLVSIKLSTALLITGVFLVVHSTGTVGLGTDNGSSVPVGESAKQIGYSAAGGPVRYTLKHDCLDNDHINVSEYNDAIIGRVTRNCISADTPVITIVIYNNGTNKETISGTITVEVEDGDAEPIILEVDKKTPKSAVYTATVLGERFRPEHRLILSSSIDRSNGLVLPQTGHLPNEVIKKGGSEQFGRLAGINNLSFNISHRESPATIEIKFKNRRKQEFRTIVTVNSTIGQEREIFVLREYTKDQATATTSFPQTSGNTPTTPDPLWPPSNSVVLWIIAIILLGIITGFPLGMTRSEELQKKILGICGAIPVAVLGAGYITEEISGSFIPVLLILYCIIVTAAASIGYYSR